LLVKPFFPRAYVTIIISASNSCGQDRQAEQDSLYEDAFDKMKRAAGVSNIDEVVQR
jgi:hypothetical protein